MGARDLSIINTPPPNRQPIQTEVQVFNEDVIRDSIYFETERGGQVFFIHNRVMGLNEMAAMIQGLCPDLSIGVAHGQLEGHILEERILDFIDKKYDVLICTNIVESGVDIPNVNTIIVNNAHQFGLKRPAPVTRPCRKKQQKSILLFTGTTHEYTAYRFAKAFANTGAAQ